MDQVTFEAKRTFIATPSGRVSYVENGEGPVALFVHGVLLNGYLWRHQLAGLADERRCIAVDLLGHGHSEIQSTQPVSFEAQAVMLAQFLHALGVEQVDLVSNDSGTGIAQIFAVTHPERLRSLTLTNGDVHDNWPPQNFAGFLTMVAQGGLPETLHWMVNDKPFFRSPDGLGGGYERPQEVADETIKAYIRPLLRSPQKIHDVERFILAFDNRQTVNIEARLRDLTVSTLIVWETGDIFFDVTWSHWLSRTIPGTRRRVELPDARLFLPEERASELNTELRTFWQTRGDA